MQCCLDHFQGLEILFSHCKRPKVIKSLGFVVTKGCPSLGHQATPRGLETFLSTALLHQQPLGFKTHCCAMGKRHPWSHLKNICKIKSIDARGKKQPETAAAPSAPFASQNISKTPAALHNVPACSCRICACSRSPHTPAKHKHAPHTDIDAYNEMCRCTKDVTELLALAHAGISIFINALILL